MDGRFRIRSGNTFRAEFEEINGATRTPDPVDLADAMKSPSTSSPKRSKRSLQKRVISIPIKDLEGSRLRGEGAPPPDSWAWRKYGQKPIKGSPYPRGYYKCSSSKGCPARKQVERSRDDPTVLVITYSCEHNHPLPAPRNSHQHHSHQNNSAAAAAVDDALIEAETDISTPDPEQERDREPEPETEPEPAGKFTDVKDGTLLMPADDECFGWFSGMEMTTASFLERPFLDSKIAGADADMALFFPMKEEEDESLFADLGELPECSVVFRHRDVGTQVQIC